MRRAVTFPVALGVFLPSEQDDVPEHLEHLVRPRGLADPLQNPRLQLRGGQRGPRPPVAVVTALQHAVHGSRWRRHSAFITRRLQNEAGGFASFPLTCVTEAVDEAAGGRAIVSGVRRRPQHEQPGRALPFVPGRHRRQPALRLVAGRQAGGAADTPSLAGDAAKVRQDRGVAHLSNMLKLNLKPRHRITRSYGFRVGKLSM